MRELLAFTFKRRKDHRAKTSIDLSLSTTCKTILILGVPYILTTSFIKYSSVNPEKTPDDCLL